MCIYNYIYRWWNPWFPRNSSAKNGLSSWGTRVAPGSHIQLPSRWSNALHIPAEGHIALHASFGGRLDGGSPRTQGSKNSRDLGWYTSLPWKRLPVSQNRLSFASLLLAWCHPRHYQLDSVLRMEHTDVPSAGPAADRETTLTMAQWRHLMAFALQMAKEFPLVYWHVAGCWLLPCMILHWISFRAHRITPGQFDKLENQAPYWVLCFLFGHMEKITLVSHCSVKDTCQCTCPDSLLYAVRCQPDHSPHCALLTRSQRSPWCFVDGSQWSQDRISHDPKKIWGMILDVEGIPISNSNAWRTLRLFNVDMEHQMFGKSS